MRRRAPLLIASLVAALAWMGAREARAQDAKPAAEPKPEPKQEAKPDEPSGASLPSGASGAMIVKPKDEAPPPPPPAQVTPPVLKRDEGAVYPDQALREKVTGTFTVTVTIEIGPDGHVRSAKVNAPVGHGFDEAAIAAAQRLEFDPAKRGDKPITVRATHVYTFAPPPGRLVGHVLSAENAPIAGATVKLRDAAGNERTAQSDAGGEFTFDALPPASYHVVIASAPVFKPQEGDENVAPGEETALTYRLTSTAPAPAKKEEEEEADEVTIHGVRPPREVTKRTLEQRELNRIPGTNGDALRALQNLPGVARPPGLAGILVVRGSAPQDTQIFVDGTPIPIVYHFGGLSSVVPTEMLRGFDFYPGNFSAQYGRGMGGIVDVNMRDLKGDGKIHGLAQVDLIDARVLAEGPIASTGWNFAVAGRRSWVDAWLKPVLERAGAGVTTAPVYYDYQAVAEKNFDKHSSFRVMLFGADDRLDLLIKQVNASDPSLGGGISAHTGFWRVQARYRNKFSDDTEFKINVAAGQDLVNFALGDNLSLDLTTNPITARAELSHRIVPSLVMNTGIDLLYAPYTVHVRAPMPSRPGQPPGGPGLSRPPLETKDTDAIYRPGLYSEFEITPWRGGRMVPGVRLDYSKDTKSWDLAPRLTVRQDLTRSFPRTTLKGGAGVFFQPPQPQETNAVFGQPGLISNRAIHYDVGVEQEITRYVEISVDGFYKQLDRLVVQGEGNSGTGSAYGAEVLLRYKPDARFFGWLAYTLSRAVRRDTPTEPERLAQYDQTHILTILGSYRLGRGWELGARFRLVSGSLYTPHAYGFFDENAGSYLSLTDYPPYGSRFPTFHQLDIRVDKTWKFPSWQFSTYLDVQNVYNQGNVEGVSSNYNSTQQTYATGLPFLPSLGLRAEF